MEKKKTDKVPDQRKYPYRAGEPTSGRGVRPAQFVKIIDELAHGPIHGAVIRRLQKK